MRQAGMPPAWEPQVWAGFAHDYAEHCGQRSRLHDGVRALLRRLRARGLRTVLLTNKEAAFARRLLAGHGLLADFDLLVAGDTLAVKKPHPAVVAHALAALQAAPDEALLVGDSVTDVRTARAAGIAVQLVRHGYPGADLAGAEAPDGWIAHFDGFLPADERSPAA
jgi:phosphoglycolate phosphatase